VADQAALTAEPAAQVHIAANLFMLVAQAGVVLPLWAAVVAVVSLEVAAHQPDYALFGPEILVHSHQQTQVICNGTLYTG
jgi:hypothetical protein